MMPLTFADNDAVNIIRRVGGSPEVKKHLENLGFVVGGNVQVISRLRAPGGCPWDRAQTCESIRINMVEEAYELVDAINKGDDDMMEEETGDVLLQAAFHTVMKEEQGAFTSEDVTTRVVKKLIFRHSHIFGKDRAADEDAALGVWEKNKREEKHMTTFGETVQAVPVSFPACMRAQKVQKRANKLGFSYPDVYWAMDDLNSELDELQEAVEEEDPQSCFEELGDVLFSAVNVARFLQVDAEESLNASTQKFIARVQKTEQLAAQRGLDLKEASIQELEDLWKRAKEEC